MTTDTPALSAATSGERHVLCVDDDLEFLKSLEFFLPDRVNAGSERKLWYRFAFFDDPNDALAALREITAEGESVAMLISDQMMPSMKGTEFLRRAREVSEESIRVLLTGHAGIESAITAINERLLDRYLTKPVESEDDFTVNVRDLLQKYEMQRTIQEQNRRIREAWEEARKRAAELAEANARLRILDRLKSDFLGFISHELRTPLSYLSAADMIGQMEKPEDLKTVAEIITRGYRRLECFIAKGLEYFQWMAANPERPEEITNMASVVRNIADSLRQAEASPIDLELAITGQSCAARIGREPAEEIVRVLLDNAVKFSPDKPRVHVALEAGSARVQMVVRDQGRGFPSEWSSELFQPFTIVESMRHREGTALNLAKVAAIVQAYGGEIRAHSAGLGQGATFIVELPVADAAVSESGEAERKAA